MKLRPRHFKPSLRALSMLAGLSIAHGASASTLNLSFNYRLTPTSGNLATIATASFKDIVDPFGRSGIDLVLTNVASNLLPGQGATSYISGLLTSFSYANLDLPGIIIEQFSDDSAQSDRWEPIEDVATVDGFTFTSELGFPRTETPSSLGARLGVGERAHVQFWNDGSLPSPLTLTKLIQATRGAAANPSAPNVMAAVKVRSVPDLAGGEIIESVPTYVVGAQTAAIAPSTQVPIPMQFSWVFFCILGGLGFLGGQKNGVKAAVSG